MIELVIEQRRKSLGGFEVGRVLPFASRRMVGPFIFFDHMGPHRFEPGIPSDVDVRPHPHIGLATITYLFDGEIMHRDSVGSEQPILPGEVNWMTSGSGITHSERFEQARREGGPLDGIQAWVALPDGEEEVDPSFTHYGSDQLPTFSDRGVRGRLVAGEAMGLKSRVKTHSPLFYVHWDLAAGTRTSIPADYSERAVYVASGLIRIGDQLVSPGQMAVLEPGRSVDILAEGESSLIAIGGEPVGPRFIEWNFVSSSKERIAQAKADWSAGRMKLPDLDNEEWIPLPPDPAAPPNPMS